MAHFIQALASKYCVTRYRSSSRLYRAAAVILNAPAALWALAQLSPHAHKRLLEGAWHLTATISRRQKRVKELLVCEPESYGPFQWNPESVV
jgi:hypothetical protein